MSSTPPVQPGWTSPRLRRSRMFAVLLLLCTVAGVWSVHQAWFAWATPGIAASCEPVPAGAATVTIQTADGVSIPGVSARGCITGSETVSTAVSSVGTPAGTTTALSSLVGPYERGTPNALLGLPRPATLLIGCGLLAAFAVLTRRGYLGIPAVLFEQMAYKDLGAIRSLYLSGSGSDLTVALPGLTWFTWALLFCSALTLTMTVWVLRVNYQQRAEDRRRAKEAGQEPPKEPTDPFVDYLGRKIAHVKTAVATETEQHAHATAAH